MRLPSLVAIAALLTGGVAKSAQEAGAQPPLTCDTCKRISMYWVTCDWDTDGWLWGCYQQVQWDCNMHGYCAEATISAQQDIAPDGSLAVGLAYAMPLEVLRVEVSERGVVYMACADHIVRRVYSTETVRDLMQQALRIEV
jgi:hypothetical protein